MPAEELFYLPISELARRIESKKLSPVELTQLCLDRSTKFGPKLNAFATLTPDLALEQAKAAEKEILHGHYRGPLHGIPYAAKDLLAVAGVPATWGAKPYANQVFDYNAAVVEHLTRVGAILIGKASMIELAGGMGYRFANASLQGAAKNPWDTKCWTCGSSSGSGAIVAAGLAPFAIGTETWGSIICPSAFCGVSGLRPTYGRVSRYGAMTLAPSMDKIGPLARSADDCARVFSAIAGHDPRDRSTVPIDKGAFTYSPSLDLKSRPLRIGWLKNAWKKIDPALAKPLLAAQKVLPHHEVRRAPGWSFRRCRQYHHRRGSRRFLPRFNPLRPRQRTGRPARPNLRLRQRTVFRHGLPACAEHSGNVAESHGGSL